MGYSYIGRCPCGVQSETLYCGYGMRGPFDEFHVPSICKACGMISTTNVVNAVPICPSCGSVEVEVAARSTNSTQSWPVSNAGEIQEFRGPLACPKCGDRSLLMELHSLWD